MKVLIVESQKDLRNQLLAYFHDKVCDITVVESLEAVSELTLSPLWEVVVLSAKLPGCFCFAHKCRQSLPNTGVIITSAQYNLKEKIKCYELDVDMYLANALKPEELMMAIEALFLKRQSMLTDKKQDMLIRLNLSSRVISSAERSVRLTKNESLLLSSLALADQSLLETWQIMEKLDILDSETGQKYLGIIVSRLRKKLKAHGCSEKMIRVVRNVGYQLTVPIVFV
jgi:DNA-binding response OmpR family regulator